MGEWMEAYIDSKDNEPSYNGSVFNNGPTYKDFIKEKKEWFNRMCEVYPEECKFITDTLGFRKITRAFSMCYLVLLNEDKNEICLSIDDENKVYYHVHIRTTGNNKHTNGFFTLNKEDMRKLEIFVKGLEYYI